MVSDVERDPAATHRAAHSSWKGDRMTELCKADYARVAPLLTPSHAHYTLLASIVEGRQPGRVFADHDTEPTAALVCNVSACLYAVCGDAGSRSFVNALPDMLRAGPPSETEWWGFTTHGPGWDAALDEAFDGSLRKGSVKGFDLSVEAFTRRPSWRGQIPGGCEMKEITEHLVDVTAAQLSPGFPFPWESPSHFAASGFGFALWRGDEALSICFAYTGRVSSGEIELAICTAEGHRRQGHALLTCSAFIERAMAGGMMPNWACFANNVGSAGLAETLGYQLRGEYSFYSLTA